MSDAATRKCHELSAMYEAKQRDEAARRYREGQKRAAEAKRQTTRSIPGRPGWAPAEDPRRPVPAGSSARTLADELDPSAREKRIQARIRAEWKERERAIYEAAHPKPKDPRSTAEQLASGAGQAYLQG